jgi:hypothetical protein
MRATGSRSVRPLRPRVADPNAGEIGERAYRRRFKGDRRDDHAVDLFREALGNLSDPDLVDRALGALGRLYNPLIDAPIVDLETRQQVAALLAAGQVEDARRSVEGRLSLYLPAGVDQGPASG